MSNENQLFAWSETLDLIIFNKNINHYPLFIA